MVTIWPIVNPEAKEIASDDCNYAVDKYDLFGGTSAIQDAEQQNASLSGRGPYLIGWSPSNTRGQPDKVVLVYDMSGFESQDSFDRAFMFWQQKVVSDPRLWRNGWSYEQIRVSVRDFFDTYAQSALDAIKIFGGGK
jgi:hypothetical protein